MRDGSLPVSDLLEPGASAFAAEIDGEPVWVSIAISLRRIADRLDADAQPDLALAPECPPRPEPVPTDEAAPPSLDRQLWAEFTKAERRIVALLVQGLQNQEIAHRLGSAEGTIRVHVAHILRKAGATTRTAFVARLYRLGAEL